MKKLLIKLFDETKRTIRIVLLLRNKRDLEMRKTYPNRYIIDANSDDQEKYFQSIESQIREIDAKLSELGHTE